ncbi:GspH/FimT family pseudopilin [Brevundimonas balnearis]|uniref:Type II secretion system protein H n=1 Tax=Brevundimonas balnearis TaxID=1572858 RepID=A0ABV6R2A0_9CAUL
MGARRRGGFSLVEVLVVVTIIALAATAVILTAPDSSPSARGDAERLVVRLSEARAEAILTSRPVALDLGAQAVAPLAFSGGRWSPLAGTRLGMDWSEGVSPLLDGDVQRVAFDPTGLAEPVEIRLSGPDGTVVVRVDATGEASLPQGRGDSTSR